MICFLADIRWQFASVSGRSGRRKLPYTFTEHGAITAANVLNSPEAIQTREATISGFELERRLFQIENILLAHDERIRELYDQIRPLLLSPPDQPIPFYPILWWERRGEGDNGSVYAT